MSPRKIVEIIAMVMALLIIIAIFVPYMGSGGYNINFWDASGDKHLEPIFIILSAIASAVCMMLQVMGVTKDSKESYIGAGFIGIFSLISFFGKATSSNGFDYAMAGYWMIVLCGIAMLVLSVVAQFISDEAPVRPQYGSPYGGYGQYGQQPGGYNPMGGYPNAQPNVPQQGGYNPQAPQGQQPGGYNPYR